MDPSCPGSFTLKKGRLASVKCWSGARFSWSEIDDWKFFNFDDGIGASYKLAIIG